MRARERELAVSALRLRAREWRKQAADLRAVATRLESGELVLVERAVLVVARKALTECGGDGDDIEPLIKTALAKLDEVLKVPNG